MSDVVLRCPHCGTTQATAGECEACHEAEVRYFCPNHAPGKWLEGPTCAECALRIKREHAAGPKPPPRPPPPSLPPRRRPRRESRRPGSFSDMWSEYRDAPEPDIIEELTTRDRWSAGPPVAWRPGSADRPGEGLPPGIRLPKIPFLGCIGQLIKLAIFLLVLAALATCWFFGDMGFVIVSAPEGPAPPVVAEPITRAVTTTRDRDGAAGTSTRTATMTENGTRLATLVADDRTFALDLVRNRISR